jgi:hypothetical protein
MLPNYHWNEREALVVPPRERGKTYAPAALIRRMYAGAQLYRLGAMAHRTATPVTTCHCGAIRLHVRQLPRTVTSCNCSICRRYVATSLRCTLGVLQADFGYD